MFMWHPGAAVTMLDSTLEDLSEISFLSHKRRRAQSIERLTATQMTLVRFQMVAEFWIWPLCPHCSKWVAGSILNLANVKMTWKAMGNDHIMLYA